MVPREKEHFQKPQIQHLENKTSHLEALIQRSLDAMFGARAFDLVGWSGQAELLVVYMLAESPNLPSNKYPNILIVAHIY